MFCPCFLASFEYKIVLYYFDVFLNIVVVLRSLIYGKKVNVLRHYLCSLCFIAEFILIVRCLYQYRYDTNMFYQYTVHIMLIGYHSKRSMDIS